MVNNSNSSQGNSISIRFVSIPIQKRREKNRWTHMYRSTYERAYIMVCARLYHNCHARSEQAINECCARFAYINYCISNSTGWAENGISFSISFGIVHGYGNMLFLATRSTSLYCTAYVDDVQLCLCVCGMLQQQTTNHTKDKDQD